MQEVHQQKRYSAALRYEIAAIAAQMDDRTSVKESETEILAISEVKKELEVADLVRSKKARDPEEQACSNRG